MPTTKLGQGYVFTRVCDSVHKGGWGAWSGGLPGRGTWSGGCGDTSQTATAAGSMHPTGMHSCCKGNDQKLHQCQTKSNILLQNKRALALIHKNAFQYDAYRPLFTVPGVSVQGGSLLGRFNAEEF